MDSKSKSHIIDIETSASNQSYSRFVFVQFIVECIYILLIYLPWILLLKTVKLFLPTKPKSLRDEIILVTGGASGIGRAYCHELVKKETQLTIIIWDIDELAAQSTVKELEDLGVYKATYFIVDVSNRAKVIEVANTIRTKIGDVTMLFNNAGIAGQVGEGWRMDPDAIEKLISVNFTSHSYTLREFLPAMIIAGKGHVVGTCSILGVSWGAHGAPYCASKFAVRAFTECIKEDIRLLPNKTNINFTLVYPEFTQTKMIKDLNVRSARYPFLVGNQTAETVARETIEGVLRNKEHVFVPGYCSLLLLFFSLCPMEVIRKFMDYVAMEKTRSF